MKKRTVGILWALSCLLVAILTSAFTFALCAKGNKLVELERLIQEKFIGEEDKAAMEDAAAAAMIQALPDQWSYYVPKDAVTSHQESKKNAYVGIGLTITAEGETEGLRVTRVEVGGPAYQAGILPGDILTEADGQALAPLGPQGARDLIRGPEGKQVKLTVLRQEQRLEFALTLKTVQVAVAEGRMLEDGIGYIVITNFNTGCSEQTISCVETLLEEGAESLIFDVRGNPGGYKDELVKVLDYLLPEGNIFTSEYTDGTVKVDTSDATCLEIPMAVLMDGDSYSAAEFFAAALSEYDWAVTVGQSTAGKGYFQVGYALSDGSEAVLSVGKYYTPKGVSLAEVNGLTPDVPVEVDEDTAALIHSRLLPPEEDAQLQAAVAKLKQ